MDDLADSRTLSRRRNNTWRHRFRAFFWQWLLLLIPIEAILVAQNIISAFLERTSFPYDRRQETLRHIHSRWLSYYSQPGSWLQRRAG
jgi:hypothetical protein